MFKRLEGDMALLRSKGVFKPAELYEFNGGIYAKARGGFVRLYADGRTSDSNHHLVELHSDVALVQDKFGRLSSQEALPNAPAVPMIKMDPAS